MLLTGIASRKCSLFPVMDNSKYNLCAGISNEINSSFHVQPSRIRNPAKSLWKYILCRRIHWRGRRGDKLQIGNVSWSQPFRRSSFPAKADKEKSSLMLTRWLFGQQQGVVYVFLRMEKNIIRICQTINYMRGECWADWEFETYVDTDTYWKPQLDKIKLLNKKDQDCKLFRFSISFWANIVFIDNSFEREQMRETHFVVLSGRPENQLWQQQKTKSFQQEGGGWVGGRGKEGGIRVT